jgi:hypothetical protein
LHEAGLKINARKSKFWTKETEYLVYVLTTDDIKPQQKRYKRYLQLHGQLESKTSVCFLVWSNTIRRSLGEVQWHVCPTHLTGKRVWSYQSHQSLKDQEGPLTLGWGTSKSIQWHKGHHCKRCGFGLPWLLQRIWDTHWHLIPTDGCSDYTTE